MSPAFSCTPLRFSRRALLLVYPPPGPMARNCLEAYQGNVLFYVGEGRGGANGDAEFFDTLEKVEFFYNRFLERGRGDTK